MILNARTYLTAAPGAEGARVVPEHDPAAAYLLGGEGTTIPDADARRYGLLPDDTAVAAVEDKAEAPTADKSVKAPPANKAIKGPAESK